MSRIRFAVLLSFVSAAAPLFAQSYYPPPPPPLPYGYQPAPAPYPQQAQPQPGYPQPAPAPQADYAPPPAAPPSIDRLEQIMWQAAVSANSASGYATYLNRYRDGEHAQQARAAIEQIRRAPPAEGAPAVAEAAAVVPMAVGRSLPTVGVPTAAVPVAPAETVAAAAAAAPRAATTPAVAAVPSESTPFVCRPAYVAEAPFEQAGEAEIGAYLVAIRMNSIGAYETYLQTYPHGVFAPEVAELVAARQGRMGTLAKLGGPGPVSARARTQIAPGDRDYPAIALRDAQEGKATAIWEVAEDGCVEACRIDHSSGSAAIDAATCRIVTARGRYDPALNADGRPIRSIDSATFAWKLPIH